MRIFDMHSDIGTDCLDNKELVNPFKIRHLNKLKQGDVKGVFSACYFDGHQDWTDMQEMIINMEKQVELNKDEVRLVKNKDDLIVDDKLLNVISVEGMCGIKDNVKEKIEWMYHHNVRVASLAWNESNALAEGVSHDPNRGLTDDGKKVISKMNELGMILDVSHLNEKCFWEAIEVTKKPLIATHSNFREFASHKRNLTKEQILAIGKNGGLIGLNAYSHFVSETPEKDDVNVLAKHARAIADLIGVKHVACGFDFMDMFNESDTMIKGLPDASCAQNFPKALLEIGFTEQETKMICFDNVLNFLKENL